MIRWPLIERITSWSVIAVIVGWLYYLTDWMEAVTNGILTLADAIETLQHMIEKFRI